MSKKVEILRLQPRQRTEYPHLKSKAELKKIGLMPSPNVKPRAVVIRKGSGYNDYFLYDESLTVPFRKTLADKKAEQKRREELKKLYTCPKCNKYIGVNKSWQFNFYEGICENCWKENNKIFNEEIKNHLQLPAILCNNPTKGIVFDVETTGIKEHDEILQISIADLNGNVLMNTYVKPYFLNEWEDAERVHGITKDMVKDAPYVFELIPKLKGIFSDIEEIVGYNVDFDLGFIKPLGIEIGECKIFDVMKEFAPLYGDWNNRFHSWAWKDLGTCAKYFDCEFKAHDSLEDAKATLFCYNKIKEMMQNGQYAEIVERNDKFVEEFIEEASELFD